MVCVDEYAMVDCELTFISLNGHVGVVELLCGVELQKRPMSSG
jgi:hypothetical protein